MSAAETTNPVPGAAPLSRILLKISGEALLGAADYGIEAGPDWRVELRKPGSAGP